MTAPTLTTETLTTDQPGTALESHEEAVAKAIALHDGWTEMGWEVLPARYSRKYREMARAGLAELLAIMERQQAQLDAVSRLAGDFSSRPSNAPDSIEHPAFRRGIRAAGREILAAIQGPR
jgi:hypothetical protein